MPLASALYIHARKYTFPWAEAWVSGPHERVEAFAELKRLAPLYPDADLSVRTRTAKTLPTITPRADKRLDMTTATGRRAVAVELERFAERLGLPAVVEDWDGEPSVDIRTPSLGASIALIKAERDRPALISWYGAAQPLQAVPGAWLSVDINSSHRRKATSFVSSWSGLFTALEIGLLAAIDGSAFDAG